MKLVLMEAGNRNKLVVLKMKSLNAISSKNWRTKQSKPRWSKNLIKCHASTFFSSFVKNREGEKQLSFFFFYCLCCLKKAYSCQTIAIMPIWASVISNRFQIRKSHVSPLKGQGGADREWVSFMCSWNSKENMQNANQRDFNLSSSLYDND